MLARPDYLFYKLVGDLFLNALKLIIVPLVTTSIILAVRQVGSGSDAGRLALKTLLYYFTTSLIAIIIGLILVNTIRPGFTSDGLGILQGQDIAAFSGEAEEIAGKAAGKTGTSFLDVFRVMVPENLFAAATDNGQLLGLITVSLVVGFFLSRLTGEPERILTAFITGVYDITLKLTDLVLRLAPIGVAALIAATVAQYYARLAPDDRFAQFALGVVYFAATALAALALHFFVTMSLILVFVARVSPLRHYRAMLPALLTAFSTASSSGTLPVTMECVEDNAGVSNKTAGFVLPLGATVNMDGTALYECVAVIFICQAFGIELPIAQQFFILIVALLTSVGVAGVPSASIVAIVVILQAVQGQLAEAGVAVTLAAGLGLIWPFDRLLDMCRTAVNVFSDSVGAVTIARTEGETTALV